MDTWFLQQKIQSHLTQLPDYSARAYELRMSSAGDCPRLLDFNLKDGTPAIPFENAIRMHTGTALHTMWREIMSGVFGKDFVSVEEEIHLEGKWPGHPDGAIHSLDALYELKNVSDHTFKMVLNQDHPIPYHVEQANSYAHVLKRSKILMHYFCKSTGESAFFIAPYSPSLAEKTIEKFKVREANRKAGLIADRPYNDPTQSPCWFCAKKDVCYAGFKNEVGGMGSAVLSVEDNSELHERAKGVVVFRESRLLAEKMEDQSKLAIADNLLKRKLNACKIGAFEIIVKIGKNGNPLVDCRKVERSE